MRNYKVAIMATYEDSSGVSKAINDIIKDANECLYIVSPYLQITDRLRNSIEYTIESGVETKLLYGKKDTSHSESEWLFSVQGLEIRFLENLHAKCYLNEEMALITSMNLYKFSIENNYEMGVTIRKSDDPKEYERVLKDVNRLFSYAKIVKTKTSGRIEANRSESKAESETGKKISGTIGYCIRCGERIPYNLSKPYCDRCFKSWNRYHNPEYVERNGCCHICGNPLSTASLTDPVCGRCISNNRVQPTLTEKILHSLGLGFQ